MQVAVAFPQFAVITAVPAFTPFTTPVLDTVATALLLVVYVTVLAVSFEVAFRVTVFPV